MKKYGTPEPVVPVPDENQPESDEQGISVTAVRQEPEHHDFYTVDILNEGQEND